MRSKPSSTSPTDAPEVMTASGCAHVCRVCGTRTGLSRGFPRNLWSYADDVAVGHTTSLGTSVANCDYCNCLSKAFWRVFTMVGF